MASVLRFDDWETTLGTGVVSTDGSGNVAVGGSSPSYKLDVTGDINATGALRIGGTAVGAYTDYSGSITISNFTIGNGTIVAQYTQVNDLVHYWGRVTWGSTTSLSGNPIHSVPIAAENVNYFGNCTFNDAGVNDYYGRSQIYGGTNMLIRPFEQDGAGYIDFVNMSATAPFTWGTGDSWLWNIVYKAA